MKESMQHLALVLSLISLWLIKYLPEAATNTIGYALILTIGVVHGANDLQLELKKDQVSNTSKHFMHRLVRYVALVLATAVLFYFVSSIALGFFIAVSAYHFGEQHWERHLEHTTKNKSLFYVSYGFTILTLFFFQNVADSQQVIESLTDVTIAKNIFTYAFALSALSLLLNSFFVLKQKDWTFWLRELFILFFFALLFQRASLIWAFAIYFIFWHSIPSLYDQIVFLYGSVSKASVIRYSKAAMIYWVAALVFLGILFFTLRDKLQILTAILVAFLAAITIPHAFLMRKIFKSL